MWACVLWVALRATDDSILRRTHHGTASCPGTSPEERGSVEGRSEGARADSARGPLRGCPQVRIRPGEGWPLRAFWIHEPPPHLAPPAVALAPALPRFPTPNRAFRNLPGALLALAGGPSGRSPAPLRPARATLAPRSSGGGPGRRTRTADLSGGPGPGPFRGPGGRCGRGERLARRPAHHLPPGGRRRHPRRPGQGRAPGHLVRRPPALPAPPLPPLGPAARRHLPRPPRPPGPRRNPPPATAPGTGAETPPALGTADSRPARHRRPRDQARGWACW